MRRALLLAVVLLLSWQALAQNADKPPLEPIYEGAEREVDRSLESILEQHKREQAAGAQHPKLLRGDASKPRICLTFDDGPHPGWTQKILDVLHQHQVRATFFVVGKMVERSPELLKSIVIGGHQVANHTFHHRNLTHLSDKEVAAELRSTDDAVFQLTNIHMGCYRPPGGQYDQRVADVGQTLGYTLILWTDDPGDYANPGAQLIEKRTLDNIQNGGVILLHDGIAQTLAILPQLLQTLKKRGFALVTVDEMLADRPGPKWFPTKPPIRVPPEPGASPEAKASAAPKGVQTPAPAR